MMLENHPRDVKYDRDAKDKFESLARRLGVDKKDVFLLAMKVGGFYDLRKELGKKPISLGQVTELPENEIRNMIILFYSATKDVSQIFDGKEVLKVCQEYANGGVHYLYDVFNEPKGDERIIEDIVEEISASIE